MLQKLACGPSQKKAVLGGWTPRPEPTRRNPSPQFSQPGCHPNCSGDQHTELLAELAFDTFANVRHYVLVSENQNQFFVTGVASMNRLRSKQQMPTSIYQHPFPTIFYEKSHTRSCLYILVACRHHFAELGGTWNGRCKGKRSCR